MVPRTCSFVCTKNKNISKRWQYTKTSADLLKPQPCVMAFWFIMATHSSTLAWKIPWTEEPGRLQPMGSQRVRHDWVTSPSLSITPWQSQLDHVRTRKPPWPMWKRNWWWKHAVHSKMRKKMAFSPLPIFPLIINLWPPKFSGQGTLSYACL